MTGAFLTIFFKALRKEDDKWTELDNALQSRLAGSNFGLADPLQKGFKHSWNIDHLARVHDNIDKLSLQEKSNPTLGLHKCWVMSNVYITIQ